MLCPETLGDASVDLNGLSAAVPPDVERVHVAVSDSAKDHVAANFQLAISFGAPEPPSSPNPTKPGARNQHAEIKLAWTRSAQTDCNDVFFGTSDNPSSAEANTDSMDQSFFGAASVAKHATTFDGASDEIRIDHRTVSSIQVEAQCEE